MTKLETVIMVVTQLSLKQVALRVKGLYSPLLFLFKGVMLLKPHAVFTRDKKVSK